MKRKIIIGSVALCLAASAVWVTVLRRPAPTPAPPDAFEDFGPVAHAFGRPGESAQAETSSIAPRRRPADALEAALEAVAAGRRQELFVHFADQGAVDPFYRQWHGQLPLGSARVVNPDDFDAGAENGHVVPVTIWIAGTEGVAGLHGEAGFATGSDGVRVRHVRLEAMPLTVPSWAEAALRVEAARRSAAVKRTATPPLHLEAPFYGIFRMAAGEVRYAVDAITGEVEQE